MPELGDKRIVRRFLILPKLLPTADGKHGKLRWLSYGTYEQHFQNVVTCGAEGCVDLDQWVDWNWAPVDTGASPLATEYKQLSWWQLNTEEGAAVAVLLIVAAVIWFAIKTA